MARDKVKQVPLVSADDESQPPFPGGWVLAIFDAVALSSPELAEKFRLPVSPRTQDRIKKGEPMKQVTYSDIESKLVELTMALFPKVASINQFGKKYVDEYFRLWAGAAEWAPKMVEMFGHTPNTSHVIARALIRDLVLRLCYLECCERILGKEKFSDRTLSALSHPSPAHLYTALIQAWKRSQKRTQMYLAEELTVTAKALQRFKKGHAAPNNENIKGLASKEDDVRLLAGIGFLDHLLRKIGLRQGDLPQELLRNACVFFQTFPPASKAETSGKFAAHAGYVDNLLLHPGSESMIREMAMPDALWRCHLYTLRFARIHDLAQAYYQHSAQDDDRRLEKWLLSAEHESGGSPDQWMGNLRER